jgi:small GTP-binding protein
MGARFSHLLSSLFKKRNVSVILLGLDCAGKTTILYKLKHGETPCTIPTIGFNVEQVRWSKLQLTVWDMGGQDKIRKLWNHYLTNIDALIWVVDSTDRERLTLSSKELQYMLEHPLMPKVPLVVLANKQDLEESMTPSDIAEGLGLYNVHRPWYIQPACAISGEGLESMLSHLARMIKI